jgi:glycosyltransferase involved in cell wall biosynthesis
MPSAMSPEPSVPLRIAVCHEWTLSRYGSENVAARLAEVFGACDVFTFAADEDVVKDVFGDRDVRTSRLGRTAFARRHWRWVLPVMSRWWRRLDLGDYDVVVTCSHATVNSIRVRPGALHVSYCCTPMRYAWDWRAELGRFPPVLRPLWPAIAAVLRRSDARRARNVDVFLADSAYVADRIERYYGRSSVVVYPPVDTEFFTPASEVTKQDFFLYAGRLVAYKRPDVVVGAARRAGVRLVVAGGGPELERLRRIAGPTVEFRPDPSGNDLRDLYRRARALVFPGVEDFGIVIVEAQACGTPVIAYGAGGALETVRDGVTGMHYHDPSPDGLVAAIRDFVPSAYDPVAIRAHAETFAIDRFDVAIREVVGSAIATRRASV